MFVVALTGGIGSGKSTVTRLFAQLGVPVIDADEISHELTAPGQPVLNEIRAAFGDDVFEHNGSLNRARLRERVFGNVNDRRRLEGLLHPAIHAEILSRLAATDAVYAILSIPLLVESRHDYPHDRVLVIDCPDDIRLARVMERDGLTREAIQRIMAQQALRNERLKLADDILDNSGDLATLQARVTELHRLYQQLARARNPG